MVNKTLPTDASVDDFVSKLDDQSQIKDAQTLIKLMQKATGQQPTMWEPSIIGFGSYHYKYDSGREGDMAAVGFSPRKGKITVYIPEGFDNYAALLEKLGKHSTAVSCLYFKGLDDIDPAVLEELIRQAYARVTHPQTIVTPEDYLATLFAESRKQIETLQQLIRKLAPSAKETISYKILAYKLNGKTMLYLAGWSDHVSIYPIPKNLDQNVMAELEPFVKGKGTLWFSLDKPLPIELVTAVILAHKVRVEATSK